MFMHIYSKYCLLRIKVSKIICFVRNNKKILTVLKFGNIKFLTNLIKVYAVILKKMNYIKIFFTTKIFLKFSENLLVDAFNLK
jgi:hypothetical protein